MKEICLIVVFLVGAILAILLSEFKSDESDDFGESDESNIN